MPATPRRRSARLNGRTASSPLSAVRRNPLANVQLSSLLERDETPEIEGQLSSIDNIISTPATNATLRETIAQLSGLKTPSTEPRPSHDEMHPKTIHQTTTKAPDSGLRLGFADPKGDPSSLAATPSKSDQHNLPSNMMSSQFEFKFAADSHLSLEARKLMENVREEAARVKTQMQAERSAQTETNDQCRDSFSGFHAVGRKIAKPTGKTGRFSDVHMAQFRKMDSITNHASAFRARPGFAQPTQQSLKRSGSKAELDEPQRPRTAGKGTPGKILPPFTNLKSGTSSSKQGSPTHLSSERPENTSPAKRIRRSELHDVSAQRIHDHSDKGTLNHPTVPRPGSSLHTSPMKSSLARTTNGNSTETPSDKQKLLSRSNSVRSLTMEFKAACPPAGSSKSKSASPSKLPRFDSTKAIRLLPDIPRENAAATVPPALHRSQSTKTLVSSAKPSNFTSRLPTFASLKSILRPHRLTDKPQPVPVKADTPDRPKTAHAAIESSKKVDFTPSVKSRYAVKLAAQSPSPAKHGDVSLLATKPYDAVAYNLSDEEDDENWEDAESEVEYPTLPVELEDSPRIVRTFSAKAKEHNRRESKEFKSIFTTLHHPSRSAETSTLTSVNTTVNKTNPTTHMNLLTESPSKSNPVKHSPSTIRKVRQSDTNSGFQPFEDQIKTVPHGLSGKKRRRESAVSGDTPDADNDMKENCPIWDPVQIPGSSENFTPETDEGDKRAGKRLRTTGNDGSVMKTAGIKKPNAAREAAARNAKGRKGKGILSMSRLNMLSRPKQRN